MKHAIFAACLALAAIIAMPVLAVSPAAAQSQAEEFTDAELTAFVDAVLEVREIGQSYEPQLEAAETEADKEAVRQEATADMTAAIKEEGVTIERYKEIVTAARSDPELANRINGIINTRQQ